MCDYVNVYVCARERGMGGHTQDKTYIKYTPHMEESGILAHYKDGRVSRTYVMTKEKKEETVNKGRDSIRRAKRKEEKEEKERSLRGEKQVD